MVGELPLKSDIIKKNSHKTKDRGREGQGEERREGGGGETDSLPTKNELRASYDLQQFSLNRNSVKSIAKKK